MQNKNTSSTWVLVADNCQAKIYKLVKFPKIEELASLDHPESRLKDHELISSKPGSGAQRSINVRYSYEPEVDHKQLEAIKFAKEVTNYLASAGTNGEFSRLYVIAEPSFLGLLRQHFTPGLQKMIVRELAKQLTTQNVASVEQHLAEM